MFSLEKCLYRSSAHFLNWIIFCYWNVYEMYEMFICFGYQSLSGHIICKNFLPFSRCLFIFCWFLIIKFYIFLWWVCLCVRLVWFTGKNSRIFPISKAEYTFQWFPKSQVKILGSDCISWFFCFRILLSYMISCEIWKI